MGEEVNSPRSDEENDLSYLFTLDKNPSHIADELDIPAYSSKFKVLKETDEEEQLKKPSRPSAVTCWNCGEGHNLRDCTKPRNHAVIAQKRSESQTKFTKAVRYHADEEQKHPHLRPGTISNRLREAMGLRPDQAPPFIYKMRELGYPPGWVEEARVSHSGLSMFDSSGQEIKDPDLEDGEIVSQMDRDKYDFRKLIQYPGFNVPFEPGTTDETEILNAHPIRESQSIKHMQHLWSGKQTGSYKRKRLKMQSSKSESPSLDRNIPPEEEDMELDAEQEEVKFLPPTDNCGFIPPLPESGTGEAPPPPTPPPPTPPPPTPPPPTPPPPTPPSPERTSKSTPSPSKAVKRKLSLTEEVSPPGEEKGDLNKSAKAASKKSDSTENEKVSANTSIEEYNGRVKSVSSGTPVITRSQFKHLPSPENFSKDICDVINFENLPNATGKYEQMYGLIKKVRSYVTESLSKADEDDVGDD